jgi:hypothetical protein
MSSDLPSSPALSAVPPDAAAAPSPSPFSPRSVFELFFKPRTFFGDTGRLARQPELWLAAYLIGAIGVMEKLDERLAKAAILGKDLPSDAFTTQVMGSWSYYWTLVLGAGVLAAGIAWLISGWFYGLRLQWSGGVDVDSALARKVWAWQSMAYTLPVFVITVMQTVMHANYLDAWSADEPWTWAVPTACVFWGCWISYTGATTVFALHRWKARIWFLIVPAVFYACIFFGATMAAITALTQKGS